MFRRVNLINQVLRTQRIACTSTATASKITAKIITCKNTKFNLVNNNEEVNKKKKSEIELASKGWQHNKSKGDHFIIHPSRNVIESNFKDSTEVDKLELNDSLIRNLKEKHNIHKATKLQTDAINEILKKNHVLIAAETGCGKVDYIIITILAYY